MVSDNVVSEGYVTDVMEHLRGEAVSLASVGTWNSRTEHSAGFPWQTAFARNREGWDVISPVISVV